MKYIKFNIKRYKGIQENLEVDLSETRTLALIGLNECGKSTILNAIFAFDFTNDSRNNGKHLDDLVNYYNATATPEIMVSATVNLSDNLNFKEELVRLLNSKNALEEFHLPIKIKELSEDPITKDEIEIEKDYVATVDDGNFNKEYRSLLSKNIEITRIKNSSKDIYLLSHEKFDFSEDFQNELSKLIVKYLPMCNYVYTRNEIENEIKITPDNKNNYWFKMFDHLFVKSVGKDLFEITAEQNQNILRSHIAEAQAELNNNFMQAWNDLGIDDRFAEALKFELDIKEKNNVKYLNITINEKVKGMASARNFDIKNRSDGFQWYYCFIMQLLYNPDEKDTSHSVLFLLDEPGMYLNPYGQTCLLKRLTEIVNSNENMQIIFSTHSHYMLDQDYIKPYQISIVEKNNKHFIQLFNLTNYEYQDTKTTPLTPLFESLKIPFDEGMLNNKRILLVEGIHDFYAMSLFGDLGENYHIYPCAGATTIEKHIPFFIMRNADYTYLVDNDYEGITKVLEPIEEHYHTNRGVYLPFPGYIDETSNTVTTRKNKYEMDDIFSEVLEEWAKKLHLRSHKYPNVITHMYNHQEDDIVKELLNNKDIKQKFTVIKNKIERTTK